MTYREQSAQEQKVAKEEMDLSRASFQQLERQAWMDFFTSFPGVYLTRAGYVINRTRFTQWDGQNLRLLGNKLEFLLYYIYLEWGVVLSSEELMEAMTRLQNLFERITRSGGRVEFVYEDYDLEVFRDIYCDGRCDQDPRVINFAESTKIFPVKEDEESPNQDEYFSDQDYFGELEEAGVQNPHFFDDIDYEDEDIIIGDSHKVWIYDPEDETALEQFCDEVGISWNLSERRNFSEDRIKYHLARYLEIIGHDPKTINILLHLEEPELVWVNHYQKTAGVSSRNLAVAQELHGDAIAFAMSDLNLWTMTAHDLFIPIEQVEMWKEDQEQAQRKEQ